MRGMLRTYSAHFPLGDLVLATSVTLSFAVVWTITPTLLPSMLPASRRQLYATGAAISAALMGFSLVSVSLMLDLSNSSAAIVPRRSPHFSELSETFVSATRYLGLTTLIRLAALILDTDSQAPWWLYLGALWLASVSALRLVRCTWIVPQMVRLATKTSSGP